MNLEQIVNSDDNIQLDVFQFLSNELFKKKQLKTINMFGGKGGFGLVLFVEDNQNRSQKYAIKAQSVINITTGQINQNALQICKHEAEVMRNCKHKNIVEIHSDYEVGFYHIIQMSLCECSLHDWIEKKQSIQISDSIFLYLVNQILDGLSFLHNLGYVLRDLSVRNILLTTDGNIKLCDFGFAKKYDEEIQSKILYTQHAKGVIFYYPPELIEDITNNKEHIKQTKKGDIWAFGVCLSLIGGTKFTEYINVWNKNFQRTPSPNVSQSANELIKFILNKNPDERPNIEQIQNKIYDLFALDQNQIEIVGENILNLSFYQNINNLNLDYINSDEQNEIQEVSSNLSVFESNQIEQKSIYQASFSTTDKVIRMIDFQFKQANELLQKYENLLQTNNENNDILITLGFIEVQYNSNIYKAKQYFKNAIDINPNDLDAYLGICECDISIRERNNYKQHIEQLKNQTDSHFQNWRLYYYLAYLYYLDFQQNDSEQCINKALELNQDSSLIISLQALIVFNQDNNKLEEVMKLFQKSENLNQNNHPDVEQRKTLFEIQFINDSTVQIGKINLLIDKGIKQFILYINLLQLYYLTKNQTQINFYQNLILKDYSNYYLVYEYLGNFEQDQKLKLQYYIKSIEIFPLNTYCIQQLEYLNIQAQIETAQLYYQQNQKVQALQIYYKIIENDKQNYLYYQYIGKVESELRCHKNSIQAYEKYLSINDKDYLSKRVLAQEYIENQQFSEAIKLLRKILQQNLKDNVSQIYSECYFLLGKAQYKSQNYRSALQCFEYCLSYKNQDNIFLAQAYHLKCQIRLKRLQEQLNIKFRYPNLLNGFFMHFHDYLIDGNLIVIRQLFLNITNEFQLFIIAETLYDFQQYDLSIDFFQKLIKINPENLDFYFYLGKMEDSKDLKQKYFMKYIKGFQRDDRIIKYLAENCLETTEKIQYYKQLVDIDSQDVQSIENLCVLYESLEQNNQSQDFFDNIQQLILKVVSGNILAFKKLFYYSKKVLNKDQYIKILEDFLKIDVNNNYVIKGLIQVIINQDCDQNQSQNYYLTYVKYNQQSVTIILDLVQETKILEQKLKYYKLILDIQPKNVQVLEQIANLFKQMKSYEELENTLNLILQNESQNQFAITQLADLYNFHFKEFDKAALYYEQLLKFEKNNVEIFKILGRFYFKNQKYLESQKMYQQIILIKPDCSNTLFKLGQVEFQLNNYCLSNEFYRKSDKIYSKNDILCYNMGINYYHMEDYEKSLKRLFKCISLKKNNGRAYNMIGYIYFKKKNKKEESIDYFRKATECDKTFEDAYYNLGEVFKELNYVYEAVQSFKQLLELNSQYKESKHCQNYIIKNQQANIKLYKKTQIDKNCNIF